VVVQQSISGFEPRRFQLLATLTGVSGHIHLTRHRTQQMDASTNE